MATIGSYSNTITTATSTNSYIHPTYFTQMTMPETDAVMKLQDQIHTLHREIRKAALKKKEAEWALEKEQEKRAAVERRNKILQLRYIGGFDTIEI